MQICNVPLPFVQLHVYVKASITLRFSKEGESIPVSCLAYYYLQSNFFLGPIGPFLILECGNYPKEEEIIKSTKQYREMEIKRFSLHLILQIVLTYL